MSDENKTLNETIDEGIAETKANAETAGTKEIETKEGMSQDRTAETQSGETAEPEYVSGIDISDIPVQDRPKFKEYLSKKAKLLEDGYQGKFKEVATFKKAQEDLIAAGLSVEEARDVLNKHLESKRNPPTTTQEKQIDKVFDKFIKDSPFENRESLEQLRLGVQQEAKAIIEQRIAQLEQTVNAFGGTMRQSRQEKLQGELNILSETYGGEIVEKYRNAVIGEGLKYPNLSAKKLLQIISPEDELEETIRAKAQGGKKPITQEKKNAISNSPSAITSANEIGDPKKSWIEEWMSEAKKK